MLEAWADGDLGERGEETEERGGEEEVSECNRNAQNNYISYKTHFSHNL